VGKRKAEVGLNNLHFHDTRHEAITRMVRIRKLPVQVLAKITGHKKIDVLVNTYYNPDAKDLVDAFKAVERLCYNFYSHNFMKINYLARCGMSTIDEKIEVIEKKKCPLCKNDVDILEDSHILPKQLYKFLHQKKMNMIQHDKKTDKLIISNKQWKEYLLCGKCEDLFQVKERDFNLFLRKIDQLDSREINKLSCRYSDSSNDFKVNLSGGLLEKVDLDTVKYFVLSIMIRQHYLSPVDFSDDLILRIENYLKNPDQKFPVDMVIFFHSGNHEFPAFSAPVILDKIDNKHISFLCINMFVHITFTDKVKQTFETISCLPEDFYNPHSQNLPFNQMITDVRKLFKETEQTPKVKKFFESL
jgi:hypothetical protein